VASANRIHFPVLLSDAGMPSSAIEILRPLGMEY
jgi:hypothetical protein